MVTDQIHQPLEGRDLLIALRNILVNNPGRHEQHTWIDNVFRPSSILREIPAADMAAFAEQPVPAVPADPEALCGTVGCIAGWAALLSAPAGARICADRIVVAPPVHVMDYAIEVMRLRRAEAMWMFSAERTRDELVEALDALIEEPGVDLFDALHI